MLLLLESTQVPRPVLVTETLPVPLLARLAAKVLAPVLAPVRNSVRAWLLTPYAGELVAVKLTAPLPEASSVAESPSAVPLMVKLRSVLAASPP